MAEVVVDFQDTIEEAFLLYAGHVLQDRAIPDARDGLKLGARQGLYAQFVENMVYSKPYNKAQKNVAAGTGLCYVHGDVPLYNTLIRMGKPFAFRYPLQDVQGNFGSLIKSDNHAASRYVEMRLSELADYLFEGLKKNAVEKWKWNYDDTVKIPSVLPSPFFYNIVNGATGIGVGMATSIPTFNLRDVNKAFVTLINNPDADFDDIYCPIDFPTGATIINEEQVKESLQSGKGKSAVVRATIIYDVKKHQLVVTEMPYMVYTTTICEQLGKLLAEDPSIAIEDVLDATTDETRIEITLAKKANPTVMKEWLYANTSLQSYYGINMTMLDNGRVPRVFGWKAALVAHLNYTKEVKRREFEFDLEKTRKRLHIVEGLLIAIEHIDAFIAIIRSSNSTAQAATTMRERYGLSDEQAKAVLDIKLSRLVNLEQIKVQKEGETLNETIDDLLDLLSDVERFNRVLAEGFEAVAKKFGDARRTTNLNVAKEIEDKKVEMAQQANADVNVIVTITRSGTIYLVEESKKAKNGKSFTPIQANDFIIEKVYGSRAGSVIVLTDNGQSYTIDLNKLSLEKVYNYYSLLELTSKDFLVGAIHLNNIQDYPYVIIATKDGMIKKTATKEYDSRRKGGLAGIKLRDGDRVCGVKFVRSEDDEVLLVSEQGYVLRFSQNQIGTTGRLTLGVKSMKLGAGDLVANMVIIQPDQHNSYLLTVTSNGTAKKTALSEFESGNRYTKGLMGHKVEGDTLAVATISNGIYVIAATKNSYVKVATEKFAESERNTVGQSAVIVQSGAAIEYLAEVTD